MLMLRNLLLLLVEVAKVGLLLDWLLLVHVYSRAKSRGVHHRHGGLHLRLRLRVTHSLLLLLSIKRRVIEGDHLRLLLLRLLRKLSLHRLADHLLLRSGSTLVVAGGYLLLHRVGAGRLRLWCELGLLNCHVLLLSKRWLCHTLLLLLVLF